MIARRLWSEREKQEKSLCYLALLRAESCIAINERTCMHLYGPIFDRFERRETVKVWCLSVSMSNCKDTIKDNRPIYHPPNGRT